MPSETIFVIDVDGKIFRQTTTKDEIDPGAALAMAFAKGVKTKIRGICEIPGYGVANACIEQETGHQYWSLEINEIVFKTSFRTVEVKEGHRELVPDFKVTSSEEISIPWDKNAAMASQGSDLHIMFMAHIKPGVSTFQCGKNYLVAMDAKGATYRLPTSNVYNHGELCCGSFSSTSMTAAGSFRLALDQFRAAPWNADLTTSTNYEHISNFFHFKPMEKGFQTMPIKGKWQTACQKISTPIFANVVV